MSSQYPARRRWWLLPVLAVLVTGLGAGAGFGIRELTARAGADQPRTSAPTTTSPRGAGDEPGPPIVQFAQDAKAYPHSEAIQKLLQRHFDSINGRDFEAWKSTVTRMRAAKYPEQQWRDEYRSTKDGSIMVHRIEPTPGGSVVLLSFISTQEPELAPNKQSGCLRWRVSYSVVVEHGELRLGPGDPAASQYESC